MSWNYSLVCVVAQGYGQQREERNKTLNTPYGTGNSVLRDAVWN